MEGWGMWEGGEWGGGGGKSWGWGGEGGRVGVGRGGATDNSKSNDGDSCRAVFFLLFFCALAVRCPASFFSFTLSLLSVCAGLSIPLIHLVSLSLASYFCHCNTCYT